jgi:hypothetical protein
MSPSKKPEHCHVAPACSVSEANAPPLPGVDPEGWRQIGRVEVCMCDCPICRPPRKPRASSR